MNGKNGRITISILTGADECLRLRKKSLIPRRDFMRTCKKVVASSSISFMSVLVFYKRFGSRFARSLVSWYIFCIMDSIQSKMI